MHTWSHPNGSLWWDLFQSHLTPNYKLLVGTLYQQEESDLISI